MSVAAPQCAAALAPKTGILALQQIQALLHSGRSAQALQAALSVLERGAVPSWMHADLCNLAGAAAHALADPDLAAQMWQRASECAAPGAAVQPLLNLAQLRLEQAHFDDAERRLRQVLNHAPGHADAAARLGRLLAMRHRPQEAVTWYRRSLCADPAQPGTHANLALALAEAGQSDAAEAAYACALAHDPDNATTHTNLGVLLAATRRPALAALSHRRALAFEPRNASAHANLGLVLVTLKRTAQALAHQQRAHELAPDHPQIRSNLGNALARLGRDDEAEPHLREAVRLDPSAASSHLNLGVWLCDQGHEQEAEQRLRDAVALRPNYALARLDLSCLLLAQGRFDEGWRLHEARHDPALPDNGISGPNVGLAVWNGEPLHGKAVLIWPEQGLGDQIQFCRFALALKALGARRITLVCQQPLQTLFETLPGVDRVVAARIEDNAFHVEPQALGEHDYWVFPLSLPLRLRTQLSDLPGTPIPYLQAEPGRVARWRQRLHDDAAAHPGAMRVGLVWRGNPAHNNDAQRSMPGLKTLAALWTVPGVRFVSLQTGAAAAQAQAMAAAQPLLALGHELLDFADTAAVLKTLDLLICVDTSIAHLAGALATPCWVMLPHRKTDWRWLKGREDSPWYPNGMRLFRQAERGAWGGVVQRVAHALRQRVSPTSGHGAAP